MTSYHTHSEIQATLSINDPGWTRPFYWCDGTDEGSVRFHAGGEVDAYTVANLTAVLRMAADGASFYATAAVSHSGEEISSAIGRAIDRGKLVLSRSTPEAPEQ